MKLVVVAMYDAKIASYFPPMMFRTRGEAIRALENTMRDSQCPFVLHPADYTLFELGEWDDQSGDFILHDARPVLTTPLEILAAIQAQVAPLQRKEA